MTEPRRKRTRTLALVTVLSSLVICVVALEVVLRFLPVSTGMPVTPVNASQPLFRAIPNRAFTHSKYGMLANANSGWINNAGFVNDQDYDRAAGTPLLAVIGDSYVEAAMVPYAQTLQGRLAAAAGEHGRVYSFGFSGAPLSQYLAWIDFARRTYRPVGYVVVVTGNDFDESLARYKRGPGFHHYVERDNGRLELRLFEYRPNPFRELVYRSALGQYLVFNLQVLDHLPELLEWIRGFGAAFAATPPVYVGNAAATVDDERIAHSVRVIEAFFRDLPCVSALPAKRVLFVVEGIREAVYGELDAARAEQSYFGSMRRVFMARADELGYPVVDLHEAFAAHFARHSQRFEFDVDWHWSGVGHGVAADAVQRTALFDSIVKVQHGPSADLDSVPVSPAEAVALGC